MNQPRLRLGEILMESGLLSKENLDKALAIQKNVQLRLGTILLQEGFISEPHLLQALSRHLSIPWVSIWRVDVPDDALALVPANVAEEFFLMPIYIRLEKDGDRALYVAMNDPSDNDALRFVAANAGIDVKPMIAGPSDIASAIRFYYYGEDVESVPPQNPLSAIQPDDTLVEDLSDEIELENHEINADNERELPVALKSSIHPTTVVSGQPDIIEESAHLPVELSQNIFDKKPRHSQIPNVEIPERLSSAPTITDGGDEVYQNREAAQREAERRIYGVGRQKSAKGFALTLLDGTTLSFGGAKNNPSAANENGRISKKDFLAALRATAQGNPVGELLPSEKWQSYAAAMLELLFQKGLFMYDEFMDLVEEIESR